MLVKNFGHLWERQYLYRGRGNVPGHLKGLRSPKSDVVDFRDQIGVYVLHDKNLQSLYVGQAGYGESSRMLTRLKAHENDHLWNRWTHFSWFGFRKVTGKGLHESMKPSSKVSVTGSDVIEQLEGLLITVLEPTLNKQGAVWKVAEEYFQHVEPELKLTSNAQLALALDTRFDEIERRLDKQ